jgi:hypothetical protein
MPLSRPSQRERLRIGFLFFFASATISLAIVKMIVSPA